MHTYQYKLINFQNDINGYVAPSLMIHLGGFSALVKSNREGLSSKELYEKLGAVWMYSRLRLRQRIPLKAGEILDMECSPPIKDGAAYLRLVDYRHYGELAATMELSIMAVSMEERKIIRPSVLESTWDMSEMRASGKRLRKLSARDDALPELGSVRVRYSDCDANRHLNSAHYADFICDHCGYWDGEPKIMDELQIDFAAESRAGEVISLLGDVGENEGFVRGITGSGAVGFNSRYKMSVL